jgi:uncharacterized membrane protein (UPF0127 family)
MRIVDSTQQVVIAEAGLKYERFFDRLRGLMFTKSFPAGGALIIEPCSSIHMLWMSYPIDVIFLDKSDCVVGLVNEIKPWRASSVYFKAYRCIELPAGVIKRSGISLGNRILIEPTQPKPPNR